jgi:P-type E1-E2 ATPase
LVVGDIVRCHIDEKFPADFALLTSAGGGDCFIKTSSLDGEKNLKKREQVKDLDKYFKKD